jgi:hypothetical protein
MCHNVRYIFVLRICHHDFLTSLLRSLTAVTTLNVVISIQCLLFKRIVAEMIVCSAHGMLLVRHCLNDRDQAYRGCRVQGIELYSQDGCANPQPNTNQ